MYASIQGLPFRPEYWNLVYVKKYLWTLMLKHNGLLNVMCINEGDNDLLVYIK